MNFTQKTVFTFYICLAYADIMTVILYFADLSTVFSAVLCKKTFKRINLSVNTVFMRLFSYVKNGLCVH